MTAALTRPEAEWLDLVADLLADPPARWPYETVARLLTETFGAIASTWYDRPPGPDGLGYGAWPPSYLQRPYVGEMREFATRRAPLEHPVLRYYLATGESHVMQVCDVPDRFAGPRVKGAWVERGRAWGGVSAQLAIPLIAPGPRGFRSFVVGRAEDYSPAEMALARRLRCLLAAVDRHIIEHAHLRAERESVVGEPPAVSGELGMTVRELAVLELLARGLTAAAIGRRLAITERTVQKHLQRVYAKLAVHDRLSAVQRAQSTGLLTAPEPPRNTHIPH